jgi:hypothetical protein
MHPNNTTKQSHLKSGGLSPERERAFSERITQLTDHSSIPVQGTDIKGQALGILHYISDQFKMCRTYEHPMRQYFIVLTPLKDGKVTMESIKAMFKRVGVERLAISLECKSKATGLPCPPHWNVVVTTKRDWSVRHDKVYKKMHWHVSSLAMLKDVERSLHYIFKEYTPLDLLYKIKPYLIYVKPICTCIMCCV